MDDEAFWVWEGWLRRGGWLGHRHGLTGNGERLQDDGLGSEPPGPRCVDRRQAKLLAHVHPAVESESDIERVEDKIARAGIEIARRHAQTCFYSTERVVRRIEGYTAGGACGGGHARATGRGAAEEVPRAAPDAVLDCGRLSALPADRPGSGRTEQGASHRKEPTAVRRYELMLVLRPDAPDDRVQAVLERTTRQILASNGVVVKAAPWGRRRLAYAIGRYREGSYHIIHFDAPSEAVAEIERTLLITEEVLRHLVTRVERPLKAARGRGDEIAEIVPPPVTEDEEEVLDGERIDESESEAAPAAVD